MSLQLLFSLLGLFGSKIHAETGKKKKAACCFLVRRTDCVVVIVPLIYCVC